MCVCVCVCVDVRGGEDGENVEVKVESQPPSKRRRNDKTNGPVEGKISPEDVSLVREVQKNLLTTTLFKRNAIGSEM